VSLWFFFRFIETERREYLWAQYVTFGIGFGSNELNVVYPTIAAAYAFLFARRHLSTTAPLFAVSAIFVVFDRLIANPATGDYAMNFLPSAVWGTFERYGGILFSGLTSGALSPWSKLPGKVAAVGIIVGIVAFAGWRARKQDNVPMFGLAWFLTILAPLLLLHDHVSSYYLTIPAIGMAM